MSALGFQIENLNFSYPKSGLSLFRNINLSVSPGERVAILGPSGCGKSTLLKILLKFEKAEFSKFDWSNTPLGRVGLVFQEASLLPWKSVFENVALPLKLQNKDVQDSVVLETIESVGLKGWEKAFPAELSGGMKMRVSIARALITRPGILMMDEPFSSLDEILREKLDLELHKLLTKEKTTFLLVTHNITEAIFLCNRIWVLGKAGQGLRVDYRVNLPEKKINSDFFLDHSVIDQVKKIRSYLKDDVETWEK